jgi:uncharacterized protein YndB with AHSA1/START domain
MKQFSAGIDIAASPDAVWAALADTERWPSFDPYCERIDGQAALGDTITVFSTLAPGRAFPVKVTAFEPASRLEWTNSLPLGTLKSVRTHTITQQDSGSRFEVTEVVTGPMLRAIGASLPDLTEPFAAFCRGLKAHVEARAA